MSELYTISYFAVRALGPLMVACFVIMYVATKNLTGRRPRPRELVYTYARYNLSKKGHAGLLTYLLIVSLIFFVFAVVGLIIGSPPSPHL